MNRARPHAGPSDRLEALLKNMADLFWALQTFGWNACCAPAYLGACRPGRLVIEFDDDGPGHNGKRKPRDGHGAGLKNTRERLRQMYDSAFSLELTRAQQGGLRVIIAIPYQTSSS